MFHNYLITALRSFTRHRLYSFINIAGLTVGLTCAIFIILFVRDQLSYDRWIPGTENLYRVEAIFHIPGEGVMKGWMGFPATQAMVEKIPEVAARTRLTQESMTILRGNRAFAETVNIVDTNFFDVIRLPFVAGGGKNVFVQPDSVVLSEHSARKYFGEEAALGKTILVSTHYCDALYVNCQVRQRPMLVSGIIRDLPNNTQLKGDVFLPNTSQADPMSAEMKDFWLGGHSYGYVRLVPGANAAVVLAKLRRIIDQTVDPKKLGNLVLRGSEMLEPHLTRFVDDHLSTDRYIPRPMTAPGNWTVVYGFVAIGILIILIASFNFINLATARAMTRAREISLRKVMGAQRKQLVVQFLGESVLTAMIAMVLALALSEMIQPVFDHFMGAPIGLHYLRAWPTLLLLVSIAVAIGLASGLYPALMLSGFRPANVLAAAGTGRQGGGLTRTLLVVFQFAVSIGLGIVALVVFVQISFAHNMDLGLQRNSIVVIDLGNTSSTTSKSIADILRASPNIGDVAISGSVPFVNDHNNWDVHAPGRPSELFRIMQSSPDFLSLYGIQLLKGRMLSERYGKDASSRVDESGGAFNVLINEAAARRLGYSVTDAVGKIFYLHKTPATIVGLVADAKLDGPQSLVLPTIYIYQPALPLSYMSVRVRAGRLAEGLSTIDATWHRFAPGMGISRYLLSDTFESLFSDDERQGAVFDVFVGIAIFIASLGLFGLAAFSTERRTKEIGIRKSFGASTRDIVLLLLWQFSIPVLIANLIAWPVAYYYLHQWLESYAYRVNLNPLYFVGAGAAALMIAWITIFAHALRAARANPIRALRYE